MLESIETLSRRLALQIRHTVWGYVRVSSEGQEDNQSLGMQREAIAKYCETKQLGTPQFMEEVASAAKPIWVVNLPGVPKDETLSQSCPRPRFMLLLNHMKHVRETLGGTSKTHLIVWRLDRLARVDYEQELFLTMFRQDRIVLHSVMPTEDHMLDGGHVKDPARSFTRTVLAAASAYERAMIELRMNSGMAYKASHGGFTGGIPPFGYTTKKGELVIDPDEAHTVLYIYHIKAVWKHSNKWIAQFLMDNRRENDKRVYDHAKIGRILNDNQKLYRGVYVDRYGTPHTRLDLKILPDDPEALLDYTPPAQSKLPVSIGLPREVGGGHPEQERGPAGVQGHGRADCREEAGATGLPTDLESFVPPFGG